MIDFTPLEEFSESQENLHLICSLDESFDPSAAVISLKGYLDHSNSIEFAEAVVDFFNGEWKKNPVILDLENLQYISSSGLGSFTTIRVQAELKESPFYLLKMKGKVRKVFDQIGFSSFFKMIDSLQDAH